MTTYKRRSIEKAIVMALRELGGNVSIKQLMQFVVKNTEIIPDNIMTFLKNN